MHAQRFGHCLLRSVCIALALMLMLTIPVLAAFTPSNGQAATLVLGQPNFTSNGSATTQNGMYHPWAIAVDPATYKVFVADFANNRVLRFASEYVLNNGAAAEAVLGQPNFTSNGSATTQNGMNSPSSVFVDTGGRLWVADWGNNRVLRFDHAATLANDANANGVLGQPDFTSSNAATSQYNMKYPIGVFVDGSGRLWVADNNRVLRFDNAVAKPNGANADGVLGQPDFNTSTVATTQNGMAYPYGLAVDTSGRLWVADCIRVLRFDNAATKPNGANADGVLGQPDFTSNGITTTQNGMNEPTGLAVDNSNGRLYVADTHNSRILVFNSAAGLANGANASYVLGQNNFTTGTVGTSATTLWYPSAVIYDQAATVLWVVDYYNNRVLRYGIMSGNTFTIYLPLVMR